ncbi:MAG: DNA-binding protein [Elusimicrobia bacterium HGW-Elusimicrobia-2]|nr:MAG: DNA-binding protein [Elusimicrobia bacterium HGW-Elusimicrobia-2]
MIIRKFNHGADLCEEIKRVCKKEKVKSGWFNVIGALKGLSIAFYDQKKKKYGEIKLRGAWEISSCMGNISLSDVGRIFVHAHINAADKKGNVKGGHLLKSEIFAAELALFPSHEILKRKFDKTTGLKLW